MIVTTHAAGGPGVGHDGLLQRCGRGGGLGKVGYLVEFDQTSNIFNNPKQEATQEYVSGRFGH